MSIAALIIAALFVAYGLVRAEFDKYELKGEIKGLVAENHALAIALHKRQVVATGTVEADDMGRGTGVLPNIAATRRGRPGKFQSFGRAKRELESQEAPPQRSVTV